MIIIPTVFALTNTNYIAGSGDGIVTVAGKPASRHVYLLDAVTLTTIQKVASFANGRYVFMGLPPDKQYMIIARDYKKEYEPFAWDYVRPASDLTMSKLRQII